MLERNPKHPRPTSRIPRVRLPRLAVRTGLALALTVPVVVAGVAATSADDAAQSALEAATTSTTDGAEALVEMSDLSERADRASRSSVRVMRPVTLKPRAVDRMWSTAPLNVWTGPEKNAERLRVIPWGTPLAVTGQREAGRAEVLVGDKRNDRWVTARHLAAKKPKPAPQPEERRSDSAESTAAQSEAAPSVGGSCSNGTSVPAGVSSNIAAIHQAVCANWPQITTYGTLRADSGDHGSGRAADIMVSGSEAWAVAEFLRANSSSFGINYVIHAQKMWSVDRAGEGWRYMEDRGSATANHQDHVHVSVY